MQELKMVESLSKILVVLLFSYILVVPINGWALYEEKLPFIRVPMKYISTGMVKYSTHQNEQVDFNNTSYFNFIFQYRFYVGRISLGTPPQSFSVFIDTSTAELAIRSPAALFKDQGKLLINQSKRLCFTLSETVFLVLPVYDSKKSSTYKKK